MPYSIAIDGPAGAGKSTIAKKIAQKYEIFTNVLLENVFVMESYQILLGPSENISEKLDAILYFLEDYIPSLQKRQLCLDTGVLVGELTPPINRELSKIQSSKERGR